MIKKLAVAAIVFVAGIAVGQKVKVDANIKTVK